MAVKVRDLKYGKEIFYELQQKGLKEPLLIIGDGLKGLSGAVKEVYPKADFL